jgi:lysophospholipase L1-like esterase
MDFSTDAATIQVRWNLFMVEQLAMVHMPATGVSGVDLYANTPGGTWRFVNNGRPTGTDNNTFAFNVPPGSQCRLYFPLYNGLKSIEIGIPKGKSLAIPDKTARARRKSVVFYGTSIVQGACASRPGMAFTSIVGRRLDVEIINLGFSGSGKMEPAMADLLAELNPSLFVLDGLWNMSPAEVTERTAPFVKRLRAAHPDTPILLVEDANVQNACPTPKGDALRAAISVLTSQGVKNLHLLSSGNVLGTDGEASVDCVHPNDLGMMRQADAVTKAIRPLLKAAK